MNKLLFSIVFVLSFGLTAATSTADDRPPNILLMIADDIGVEALSVYGLGNKTALTPNINKLAASGVVFEQFWAQPTCTPTRAEMLTGRHAFRTGVTRQIGGPTDGDKPDAPEKPDGTPTESVTQLGLLFAARVFTSQRTWGPSKDEFTLPMALKSQNGAAYDAAAIGKWHMADTRNGWTDHPKNAGFDHYAGPFKGFPEGYYSWNKLVNGTWTIGKGYGPTDKVDDAIQWIGQRTNPWFLWLAFNAPHTPFHKPPTDLINSEDLKALDPEADPLNNPPAYFRAMVEAMDTEIGRLLSSIDPEVLENTVVIFLGDNGTDRRAISAPFRPNKAKGTIYNGGIHTPLIIAGRGVSAGRVKSGLAKSVDVFNTIVELSGRVLKQTIPSDIVTDSVSLVPYLTNPARASIRTFNYVDYMPFSTFSNPGNYALRDARYKYVVNNGNEELFDLSNDIAETKNLLEHGLSEEAEKALADLKLELSKLRSDL